MRDLMEFLRCRLDDDEHVARAASTHASPEWHLDDHGETVLWWPPEPEVAQRLRQKGVENNDDQWRGETIGSAGPEIAPHIARHDPARVLSEVDAKRRIVELHSPRTVTVMGWGDDAPMQERDIQACSSCGTASEYPVRWPCPTLRALAAVWADHPDYQPEWRPWL